MPEKYKQYNSKIYDNELVQRVEEKRELLDVSGNEAVKQALDDWAERETWDDRLQPYVLQSVSTLSTASLAVVVAGYFTQAIEPVQGLYVAGVMLLTALALLTVVNVVPLLREAYSGLVGKVGGGR